MNIAVVTGASGGIGREFVLALLKREDIEEVWAIARSEEKLARLREELGAKLRFFATDLSDLNEINQFQKTLEKEKPNVVCLVNSAGFGKFCAYDDISINQSMNMIDLNCKGLVAMTLSVLPYMNAGAAIVNLASAAAFQPLPYENLYAATKAFVRSYSRALNIELKECGITVTCVCPSWVETEFFHVALAHAADLRRHGGAE